METKQCSTCGLHKPQNGFYKNKSKRSGYSNVCKPCSAQHLADRRKNYPFEAPAHNARHRAKRNGLPFDIDPEYLEDIWTGVCPVFGTKLNMPGSAKGHNTVHTPSLDRIRPDRGYVKGNVIWISMYANVIKSQATHQQIRRVADWLEEIEKEIEYHETS